MIIYFNKAHLLLIYGDEGWNGPYKIPTDIYDGGSKFSAPAHTEFV